MMMTMDEETKKQIDQLSLVELFSQHRFAPIGDPRYQGDEGEYRVARLAELRSKDPGAYVQRLNQLLLELSS